MRRRWREYCRENRCDCFGSRRVSYGDVTSWLLNVLALSTTVGSENTPNCCTTIMLTDYINIFKARVS